MRPIKLGRVFGWFIGRGINAIAFFIQLSKYRLNAKIECHRCGIIHNVYRITWGHLLNWGLQNRWWITLALLDGWICDGRWNYCPKCAIKILDFVYRARKEAMEEAKKEKEAQNATTDSAWNQRREPAK